MIKSYLILLIFYLITVCTGCIKDDLDYDKLTSSSWEPDIAVPLINSELTFRDLIGITDSSAFQTDTNHLVSLVYRNDIYNVYANEILTIPYQEDNQTIRLGSNDSLSIYNSSVEKVINNSLLLSIPGGAFLNSIILQSALLEISINSFIPLSGVLNVNIPTLKRNGIPFSNDINFNYTGSIPFNISESFDLSGYNLDLSAGNNQLGIIYTATFFQQSNLQTSITNLDFRITIGVNQISPSIITGSLGNYQLAIEEDTTRFNFFNSFQAGSFYFKEPRLTFYFENSIGIPISLSINSIIAYTDMGSSLSLTGYPSAIQLPSPAFPGQKTESSFVLTTPATNLDSVLAINPNYMVYLINANANSTSSGFLTDSSSFNASVLIEIPLICYATGFTIQDTFDFKFERIENVLSADFRMNFSNGFPVSALNQIYFTDDKLNLLDSMFAVTTDGRIESAQIDLNGIVTASSHLLKDISFNGDKLNHLFNCRKLIIKSIIQTTDAPNRIVEIYDNYSIKVKVGVRATYKVKF